MSASDIFFFFFLSFFSHSKTFCLPIEVAASQLNVSGEALINVFFFLVSFFCAVAFCFLLYGDVCVCVCV